MEEKKSKVRMVLVIILVSIVAILIGLLAVNANLKKTAVNKLSTNIVGMTFDENEKRYANTFTKIKYVDSEMFSYYAGSDHVFAFNDDGTVTGTFKYKSHENNEYTDPVTVTIGYSVKYTGGFIYDPYGIDIILDYGDVLGVGYKDAESRKQQIPSKLYVIGQEHFPPGYSEAKKVKHIQWLNDEIAKIKQTKVLYKF